MPGVKENALVSFMQRKPDAYLARRLCGGSCSDDALKSWTQLTQPGSCSVQKQDECLRQKRGFSSSFDKAASKLVPPIAAAPTDGGFSTRPSNSKWKLL